MTRTDKKHTAISKLILTAAATGIGISAVPYAQADGNEPMTVRKLTIEKSQNDDENEHKSVYDLDTFESHDAVVGYNGGGTLITEIADGEINLGSTDAVTGGQLYSYVPEKIEKKLEEFIQGLPDKFNQDGDVKIEYSYDTSRLTLTLSEDLKKKIDKMSNSGGKGDKGEKGEKGDQGIQGERGAQGDKGEKGEKGDQGIQGERGAQGDKGEQGEKGDKGENGKSAYEIWKEKNPTLADTSEAAFLKSLKGEKGEKGAQGEKGEQGEKGDKGENGKSAYEIWKSLDTGKRADKTERDFIDFLKAEADTAFTRTEESDGTMLTAKGKITNERPNGEVRISGLAAGRISPSSSDAVNGAQLFEVNERISSIEQKVDKLDKSMNGGIAKAGAVALLPQPTYAGHSMVSASTAHYNGEQALAIGYSSLSDNGKVILKAGASFNFSGNNTKKPLFGAAFGYQW
ncbi:YadA-like family protein [Neisseria lactamica]|uniref:YadA-like family protein n=1 Tax=Neisseria lactamica TaxID=486 RepID=UPI001863EEA3|nr:YadA-like family protein [Neisseria lactamica]